MEGMNKFKSLGIVAGIILLAVGIIFLVFSVQVTEILGILVGLGILCIGVVRLVQALKGSPEGEEQKNKVGRIILSIVMIAIGAFLLIDNNAAISLVGIVIGIFAFVAAFDRFTIANELRKEGMPIGMTIISGIIHIAFGVLMIYASFMMINILVILSGIYLIVSGVMVMISVAFVGDLKTPKE